jgi:hypothetical protein
MPAGGNQPTKFKNDYEPYRILNNPRLAYGAVNRLLPNETRGVKPAPHAFFPSSRICERRQDRSHTMQRQNDRDLREQLVKLRTEHRELDEEIVALETSGTADQLLIRRLKKKKLGLKDQITAVEDQLLPDIIA